MKAWTLRRPTGARASRHVNILGALKPANAATPFKSLTSDGRFHLSYQTSWDSPSVHYGADGGEWRTLPLEHVASSGPGWRHVALEAPQAAAGPLEFVVTDGGQEWDKAEGGTNYTLPSPGRYLLRQGALRSVATPPVLVVSDLDDTMVGDDAATLAFTEWWREVGVPSGGRLAYNTGRSLDLFRELMHEKAEVLAEPDMLISSVGTKIYLKRGGAWEEDAAYSARLGRGWRLDAAREAAYSALDAVGKDAMHFRPPGEMNEHKVTCGVRADVLARVRASIAAALDAAGVAHRLVVSGKGDWRYVDLVPAQAGKLQALEYARKALGFGAEQTVACGDSGNDVDMLEGRHHAVVVGNAQPDLMEWARERTAAARVGSGSGSGVGAGRPPLITRAERAAGILEGLQQLGFRE